MKRFLGLALISVILAGFTVVIVTRDHRPPLSRQEEFQTAVDRYGEYARAYSDSAQNRAFMITSCYGRQWDRYSKTIARDIETRRDDPSYLKQKSAHFGELTHKYSAAANHPEAKIALDPPLAP